MSKTASSAGGSTVAIVGMAGRFPGAPDLDTFWHNLRDGVDSISVLTADDTGVTGASAADPNYVPARGVLEGAD